MNATVYIFGKSGSNWMQSTYDYSSDLYDNGFDKTADSQLRLFRRGPISYAVYYRKLTDNKWIGGAIVLNGDYISDIPKLFILFEQTMQHLIEEGSVVKIDEDGEITLSTTSWSSISNNLEDIKNWLHHRLNSGDYALKRMPTYNMGARQDNSLVVDVSNVTLEDIYSAASGSCELIIVKDGDIDTEKLRGYRGQIRSLYQDKINLEKNLSDIKKENSKLKKANKNFSIVVVLFVILLAGLIVLMTTRNTLQKTEKQLTQTQTYLDSTKTTLNTTRDTLSITNKELSKTNKKLDESYEYNIELKNKIESLEKELDEAKQKNSSLSTENSRLKSKIAELEYNNISNKNYSKPKKYSKSNTKKRSRIKGYNY